MVNREAKLMKTTWWSQPHVMEYVFHHTVRTAASAKNSIDIPLISYFEGIGTTVTQVKTNRQNPSFAEVARPHCYPESMISEFNCSVETSLTANILDDNIPHVKFGLQVIAVSFDDLDAKDEVSGLTIGQILELQSEDTDRSVYPIFNGTDVMEPFTGTTTLATEQAGLTTDQKNEYVDFDLDVFYDQLHYGSVREKLQNCQSGIRWYDLGKHLRNKIRVNIHLKDKAKYMNEYAYMGVRLICEQTNSYYQPIITTEVTADEAHLRSHVKCRYNEWNENFDFTR